MKIIKLNEDYSIGDEPIAEIEIPDEQSNIEVENNGISALLISALNNEWSAIQQFNDIIVNTNDEDIKTIINNIIEDKYNHIGQLQGALNKVTPHVDNIIQGEEDAVEQIGESFTNGTNTKQKTIRTKGIKVL